MAPTMLIRGRASASRAGGAHVVQRGIAAGAVVVDPQGLAGDAVVVAFADAELGLLRAVAAVDREALAGRSRLSWTSFSGSLTNWVCRSTSAPASPSSRSISSCGTWTPMVAKNLQRGLVQTLDLFVC